MALLRCTWNARFYLEKTPKPVKLLELRPGMTSPDHELPEVAIDREIPPLIQLEDVEGVLGKEIKIDPSKRQHRHKVTHEITILWNPIFVSGRCTWMTTSRMAHLPPVEKVYVCPPSYVECEHGERRHCKESFTKQETT